MKILHIITRSDLGGAQSVVINLANAMSEKHEITVVAGEDGPMWDALDNSISKIKIKEIVRDISVINDGIALFKLKRIYSSIKPDIVHLHSSKIGALGRLAFPSKKIIYTVHGFDSIRIANRKFLFIEKLLKKFTRKIVAVSDYDFKMLKQEGIVGNTVTIYNGIEDCSILKFNKILSNEIKYQLEELKKNHFVIMAIARISPQKKFDLFCDIAKAMENNKRFIFVWVGNNSNEIVDNANVIMLGEIPKASQCFRYADVCVLPTNYEGLPISIIEALAFGIPVVASNVGGVPEILDDNNGSAVSNTIESFVDVLKKLEASDQIYQSSALHSRKTYVEKFTINKMAEKYETLYLEVKNNVEK